MGVFSHCIVFLLILLSLDLTDFKTRRVAAFKKNFVEFAELELKHARVSIWYIFWWQVSLMMSYNVPGSCATFEDVYRFVEGRSRAFELKCVQVCKYCCVLSCRFLRYISTLTLRESNPLLLLFMSRQDILLGNQVIPFQSSLDPFNLNYY